MKSLRPPRLPPRQLHRDQVHLHHHQRRRQRVPHRRIPRQLGDLQQQTQVPSHSR